MTNDATDTTPPSVPETGTTTPKETVDTSTVSEQNTPLPVPKPNRKSRRQMVGQQQAMGNFVKKLMTDNRKRSAKFKEMLAQAEAQVGKDEYDALVAVCTVQVPEKKDKDGNVLQPASSNVNYRALLAEAKNLAVLQREKRIKAGERKRSTGRSSRRRRHSSTLQVILNRNKAAIESNDIQGSVKV